MSNYSSRASTKGQLVDRQIAALTAADCVRVFADKKAGKNAEREELWRCLDYLRPGDTLVVALPRPAGPLGPGPDLDRLRVASAGHRLPVAARGAGHHDPGRPPRLPRVRRPRG
ncbi:recombinase family protein [Streptomyces sp. V4I8]|uniref:recombinase family protein n=1 Tax=Streptomyces sp. V4I8 TaxID=3156469 RepID=UPI003513B0E3